MDQHTTKTLVKKKNYYKWVPTIDTDLKMGLHKTTNNPNTKI
jgi:hypothetical protein